jgi:hypothetical protein
MFAVFLDDMDAVVDVFTNDASIIVVALTQERDQELAELAAAFAQIPVFVNIVNPFRKTWCRWRTSAVPSTRDACPSMCLLPPECRQSQAASYDIISGPVRTCVVESWASRAGVAARLTSTLLIGVDCPLVRTEVSTGHGKQQRVEIIC